MSDSLDQHRMTQAAAKIAREIAPRGPASMQHQLQRAALDGMAWAFQTSLQRIEMRVAESTTEPKKAPPT